MENGDAGPRKFQMSKMFEHWMPTVLVGAVVIYANFAVMQSQVTDLKTQVYRLDEKVSEQNGKLIGLNAQVAAYLGQQTQLNNAMESRMTYMERLMQQRLNSGSESLTHGR